MRVKCEIGFEKPWAHGCFKQAGNLIDVRTDLKQDEQQVQKVSKERSIYRKMKEIKRVPSH